MNTLTSPLSFTPLTSLTKPTPTFTPSRLNCLTPSHPHVLPVPPPLQLHSDDTSVCLGAVEPYDDVGYDFDDDVDGVWTPPTMAVPKKRTSYTKKRIRKNVWKRKGHVAALKALSLAKSFATGNSTRFLIPKKKGDEE